ncbi:MAG: hypothetical protein MJ000_11020 [Bacteroidales bacterium]|nr:hypothetical protein [Bacteroidales bacterium]
MKGSAVDLYEMGKEITGRGIYSVDAGDPSLNRTFDNHRRACTYAGKLIDKGIKLRFGRLEWSDEIKEYLNYGTVKCE